MLGNEKTDKINELNLELAVLRCNIAHLILEFQDLYMNCSRCDNEEAIGLLIGELNKLTVPSKKESTTNEN